MHKENIATHVKDKDGECDKYTPRSTGAEEWRWRKERKDKVEAE